jgi:hypothetical protein
VLFMFGAKREETIEEKGRVGLVQRGKERIEEKGRVSKKGAKREGKNREKGKSQENRKEKRQLRMLYRANFRSKMHSFLLISHSTERS